MKWTKNEIEILEKYYPDEGILKCCELIPYRSKLQIKGKINKLKLKSNNYDKWTDEEENLLKEAWELYSMEDLLKTFPNRSYQKILLHAQQKGYKNIKHRGRKSNLDFLNLNKLTPQSAYWWGFIMADGHLSKTNTLMISLKDTDKIHLEKLSKYINVIIRENNGFCFLSANDKNLISECKNILHMEHTSKTYFPPNLSIFEEFFIYFFIGFIDGDGCLWFNKNHPQLKIELYKTWLDNLNYFKQILKDKYNIENVNVKFSKKGTAVLTISNRWDILKISEYCKEIDYLERKWDKILNYKPIAKQKHIKTYEEYILKLKSEGINEIQEARKKNKHPERCLKRFNISLEQVAKDLKD